MKISIGITTYNRLPFLKNCIKTLLDQGEYNIEILIGNDFVSSPISIQELETEDHRIKILNYEKNKGEFNNLNHLLDVASGEYFFWMADDDEFNKDSLRLFFDAINKFPDRDYIIPQCHTGDNLINQALCPESPFIFLDKNQFLEQYIEGKYKLQGVYILFKTEYLRKIGGIKKLGPGAGFYSDSHLTFKAVLNSSSNVCFIDYSCTLFRVHDQSISNNSGDLRALLMAQQEFTKDFMEGWVIFSDFASAQTLDLLFKKWFIPNFITVSIRNKNFNLKNIISFILLYLLKAKKVLGIKKTLALIIFFLWQSRLIIKALIHFTIKGHTKGTLP